MSNVEQWEHDEQRAMENEIISLREQVEKLKAELTSIDGALSDPRANLTLTTSEIIWELKEQVERLTKDADRLNYLQEHGSTVHLVSTTNSHLLSFVIGGLHRSKRLNLREAIDAAMQEDKQ